MITNEETTITISVFDNVKINVCERPMEGNFDEFVSELADLAQTDYARKEDAPLFASCTFRNGKRRKDNALQSSMIVLDYDGDGRIEEISGDLRACEIRSAIYTTASHTPEQHKFQVLLPLAEPVGPETYRSTARAVHQFLPGKADPTKFGAESMFYLPGNYPNGRSQIIDIPGQVLGAEDLIKIAGLLRKEFGESVEAPPKPRSPTPKPTRSPWAPQARRGRTPEVSYDITSNPLVSADAVDSYLCCGEGEWHHERYRFMCSVAGRARTRGVDLTAEDLRAIFNNLDDFDGGHYRSDDDQRALLKDAEKALQFVVTGGNQR